MVVELNCFWSDGGMQEGWALNPLPFPKASGSVVDRSYVLT